MFGFNGNRRRSFDRQNDNEQNSTGYREKTVFSTDFGVSENNNYQNGGYNQSAPQNNGFDGGHAQNAAPNDGGYANTAQQSYGYAQSAAPVATAQASDLPMVFASRTHRDIYVYEYPDRVEWYLKTATCMHLFNIDKKQ